MPRIIGFSLITVLLAAGGVAKADAFELYLQGHGGYSGDGSSPAKRFTPTTVTSPASIAFWSS